MKTAKLFASGRSQAVRLPREFRLVGKEVYVRRIDGVVLLFPKRRPWTPLLNSLDKFSDDSAEKPTSISG